MKVLHIIPTLDPRAGGPPLIVAQLAAAQAVLGHDVHVLTYRSRAEGTGRIASEAEHLEGFNRITLHYLPFITWRERILGNDANATAKRIVPKMDVVHLHGVWEPQLHHTAAVARRFGKPYLVLLHGMLLPWPRRRGRLKKHIAMAIGARQMLRQATLQFLSADEEAAAREIGFTNAGVIIPNATMLPDAASLPSPGAMRIAYPDMQQDPYVLFLGRLHEQKGIDLLLSAFQIVLRQIPTARLVIAGPDYGRSGEIKAQVAAMGIQDRLHLIGPIFGRVKLAALRDAACFCLPSRHEGFSLAILESLANGTPVVISPECHFPEVAAAGAGLIPPLEAAAIAGALSRMLLDAPFRRSASLAATQLITDHYTWPIIAQQSLHTYHRMTNR